MYKEIIISIIILISILVFDFVLKNYTENWIGEVSQGLTELENDIREKKLNNKQIQSKTYDLYSKWEEYYENLAFYIEHDELEKVETNFIAGKSYIDSKKYEDAMSELEKTSFVLKHIKDKYSFNLENIF